MEVRRFFVRGEDVCNDRVMVSGNEFEHMIKVLRYKVGYRAYICRNDGTELLCEITDVFPDRAELKILSEKRVDTKGAHVTLYAGLLKNNKLDLVIQKAVELGVDRVIPFLSSNCAETKFNLDRAQKIALEAAKQCGSSYLSEVGGLLDFEELLDRIDSNADRIDSNVLFFYEAEKRNKLSAVLSGKPNFKDGKISVIVGPEGGFTPCEAEKIVKRGAVTVTLGKRILRAETAGIVACALTLDALGELDHGE